MSRYLVFSRTWWKENPSWPDGLEPDGAAPRRTIGRADTIEEAREMCAEWMATHQFSKQDRRLGLAAEFTS